jgi:predicted nucleic acid-binding protein
MLLVDTSAWVEVFRKPARLDLDDIGGLDEVVTCL